MAIDLELNKRILKIFFPYASEALDRLEGNNGQPRGRLVHYTSADGAIKILQSKRIWLRNTRVMSDWSEIGYGLQRLQNYFNVDGNAKRQQFYDVMHACEKNSGEAAINVFDNLFQQNQFATYISCFSEHSSSEDNHGRLSMWRAFGRDVAGVALVLNPPPIGSALPLNVALHRVAYFTDDELRTEFDTVLNNIKEHADFLKNALPDGKLVHMVYRWLMITTISLKHKGFHEENEWRLIYSPTQYPSVHIEEETITRDGIPQVIYKLPLQNNPEANITNIEASQILDRVIIGPTPYASAVYDSILKELNELGVENAANKIVISDIPIR